MVTVREVQTAVGDRRMGHMYVELQHMEAVHTLSIRYDTGTGRGEAAVDGVRIPMQAEEAARLARSLLKRLTRLKVVDHHRRIRATGENRVDMEQYYRLQPITDWDRRLLKSIVDRLERMKRGEAAVEGEAAPRRRRRRKKVRVDFDV